MTNQHQQPISIEHQKLVFEEEARRELLKGAEILTKAVSSTMGPAGHSVIIDNEIGGPSITKDGVSVAKAINLKNRLQAMGADLIKEVANKTNDLAGDGTSTATILAHALLKNGNKMIATGRSSTDLKKGMDVATEIVLNFLKENCISISNQQDIINVGTISSNGDKEIGKLIANAIDEVGVDGLITIEPAKSVKTSLHLAKGMQIDSGFISPFFITNSEKQICELEDPYILITANKITSLKEILPVLEQIDTASKPLLIIAADVEGEALHTLVVNKMKGIIQVCAVKAPSYGEHRADILSDLGIVIEGEVLGATSELSIDKIKLDKLGHCKKVTINRNKCTFLVNDENEDKEDSPAAQRIQKRMDIIRKALEEDSTLDGLRMDKFRERLAKLSGGIAVIQVGGSTEIEILEKKDRVEDAMNATQAAAQEGVVPGGGTALFYASQHLHKMIKAGFFVDQRGDITAGVQLIADICEIPFKTIIENSGEPAAVIADRLKQNWSERKVFSVDVKNLNEDLIKEFTEDLRNSATAPTIIAKGEMKNVADSHDENLFSKIKFGYNVSTQKFGDLIDLGIIDPVKVTRLALLHAVGVMGLVLTCNAVIVHDEELVE